MQSNHVEQRESQLPDQQLQQPTNLDLNLPFTSHISQGYNDDNNVIDRNKKQYSSDNLPNHIIRDNPKPAVFIARKLFSDFVQSVNKKIETILNQDERDRPIFKRLQQNEDVIHDQILEALGAISEYCLPSLLSLLITWYHHQLSIDEKQKPPQSLECVLQQQQQNNEHHPPSDCGSPCNDTLASISSLIRSPTPSCQETTTCSITSISNNNQTISITSTLPLDYQSPSSLTVIGTSGELNSSAANTSNSTATNVSSSSLFDDSTNTLKRLELAKARKLLIEFSLCQALIEIFNQLYLHPGHEDLIGQIEDIAFEHFKYVEGNESNADVNQLAEKFAEVIGVLARTRFKSFKKRFIAELNELRAKEPTSFNIQCIVALLSGMKFFRIKMAPIEEFEASLQFLQECAEYFLEVRHKSIKHALAGLFVEILVPMASSVKNEVKIPCLKNFVDTLWAQSLDMCTRKKYSITLFPLVTCLLCVSQRSFFLTNWTVFLNMCLSNLKNRDQKMCRTALESLYRLIWIYMIRVKCESNNITQARLHSIVDALFPRGSRTVVPRDAPLTIFVHIIQFIAQERLDFAMRHIVFDLLSVDRLFKVIVSPERMNIGLQAFLVVADSLQQKDGEQSLPKLVRLGSTISDSKPINRRSHVHKMLNDDAAKSIGIYPYYSHIQKSFNDILKALDAQYGRPLLLTTTHNTNKEPDDMITSERRPKIELFKTCVAAIPRLMPEGMSKADLIDLLSRMTVHVDEEMRKLAIESLQNFITDFADWRLEAIEGFTSFLVNQIDESFRNLVDNALKTLLQLLICWKSAITPSSGGDQSRSSSIVRIQTGYETVSSRHSNSGGQIQARKNRALAEMRLVQSELSNNRFDRLVNVIQKVEGASLVMLCSCHQPTRRLASHLLREARVILKCYSSWTCMEQFGFKSPDDCDEEDLSASLRGSLSADNLSRITTTSASGPAHSSMTSMNTQTALATSVSKMCIANGIQQQHFQQHHSHQHDPYDSDIENNLADCFTDDANTSLIFWIAVIMLESDLEHEYTLASRLLKKILPTLPFEQAEFVEEVDKNLAQMKWDDFPGIHSLVLKGSKASSTYDISICLLDLMTPILNQQICCANKADVCFPLHVMVLTTHLLSNYDDPTPYSLNIARRIAIWCDENSQKLDNLSTVMTLYSRRCFSKDGFQWLKCVVKYLYDAYPQQLPTVIPHLVDMLETCPLTIQKLIAPILYCILNYVDINSNSCILSENMNNDLTRMYAKYLGGGQWQEAVQIFKLIVSRSSQLASNKASHGRELPGRTMDFNLNVESIPALFIEEVALQANKVRKVERGITKRWKWVFVRASSDED